MKNYTPEQIINSLREAEMLISRVSIGRWKIAFLIKQGMRIKKQNLSCEKYMLLNL